MRSKEIIKPKKILDLFWLYIKWIISPTTIAIIEILFNCTNTSIKMIIEIIIIHFLYFGLRWIKRGLATSRYAIEFRPSVKTLPTSKISLEYDFPTIPSDVEIIIFRMYRMAIKAIEFNSFLNLLIEFIERKEIGKINAHI